MSGRGHRGHRRNLRCLRTKSARAGTIENTKKRKLQRRSPTKERTRRRSRTRPALPRGWGCGTLTRAGGGLKIEYHRKMKSWGCVLYNSAEVRSAIIELFRAGGPRRMAISAFAGDGADARLPCPKDLRPICSPTPGATNPARRLLMSRAWPSNSGTACT